VIGFEVSVEYLFRISWVNLEERWFRITFEFQLMIVYGV
jgi:hypothetical protein